MSETWQYFRTPDGLLFRRDPDGPECEQFAARLGWVPSPSALGIYYDDPREILTAAEARAHAEARYGVSWPEEPEPDKYAWQPGVQPRFVATRPLSCYPTSNIGFRALIADGTLVPVPGTGWKRLVDYNSPGSAPPNMPPLEKPGGPGPARGAGTW